MSSFNDVPKDVIWLIIKHYVKSELSGRSKAYEEGWSSANFFPTALENWGTAKVAYELMNYACVNKKMLSVIRSKCIKRKYGGWLFIRGSL